MKQWISQLKIEHLKSFPYAELEFSPGINLLVGRNNSGKSTILQSILILQSQSLSSSDRRAGLDPNANASIEMAYNGTPMPQTPDMGSHLTILTDGRFTIKHNNSMYANGAGWNACFQPSEPNNLIYPYLSKRKVGEWKEQINASETTSVRGNFSNLNAKVDRISDRNFPAHERYRKACEDIIGFPISSTASPNGKQATYTIGNFDRIALNAMGEGVANLLGLVLDLCVAEDKVFLIEEPENDIHPLALKKLMELVCEKAENNQLIITTHSNIVLKYLGAYPDSKIFRVDMKFENRLPTSSVKLLDQSPEARRKILEDLGYELYDFDLWKGWLFLEESSAEKIIREYLIPWFFPKLQGKLRTFSATSRDQVAAKFDDFNRLFVFLHLEASYKNRVWVVIDDGEAEKQIIEDFRKRYSTWNLENFRTFDQHDFESYYPYHFQEKVQEILSINNRQEKRTAKKTLLADVEEWIMAEPAVAKKEFGVSAKPVIEVLENIAKEIG